MLNQTRAKGSAYLVSLMALVAGLAIAWMDTRPSWDDAGITAGALALAAALASVAGARPWLVVLLVAGPLVIVQIGGGLAILAVAVIAAVGAAVGWGARRTVVG